MLQKFSNTFNIASSYSQDLNEARFKVQEEHLNRMKALCRNGNDVLHLHALTQYELSFIQDHNTTRSSYSTNQFSL